MKIILGLLMIVLIFSIQNFVKGQAKVKDYLALETKYQKGVAGDTLSYMIKGVGHQLSEFQRNDDYIKCARNSNVSSSYNTIIRFAAARNDTGFVGTWTVRNISPAEPDKNKPETTNFYFYDGIINFGAVDPSAITNQKYVLKGTATYMAGNCRENDRKSWAHQYRVRIWGQAGSNRINFRLENEATGELYASATFSSDVDVSIVPRSRTFAETALNGH